MGLKSRINSGLTRGRGFLKREFSFINGNYRILIISWVLMDLAMEIPVPYYQPYVQELGGKTFPLALGIIGLANFLALALVAFPGGYLADKYGRRWLITTMTFGLSASYIFYALAPSWHFILAGGIINGLCLIYQPALFAMVQDSLPEERRGVGSSLIQMIHGTFNTPGPIIGGLLTITLGMVPGMRIVYFIVLSMFLAASVWRLKLKETVQNPEPIKFRYFISSYPQAIRECCINVWKIVPRSVLWLFLVQVMLMFANSQITAINELYAIGQRGLIEDEWFLVFIPLLVTMMVASIPIGKMIDKIGPKKPLLMGPILLASSALIFAHGNFFTIMISMVLNGLIFLLIMASAMSLTAALVSPENRGKVRGFLNFIGNVFTGIGIFVGVALYNFYPPLPFYLAASLAIPMFIVIILRIHTPPKQNGMIQGTLQK